MQPNWEQIERNTFAMHDKTKTYIHCKNAGRDRNK